MLPLDVALLAPPLAPPLLEPEVEVPANPLELPDDCSAELVPADVEPLTAPPLDPELPAVRLPVEELGDASIPASG